MNNYAGLMLSAVVALPSLTSAAERSVPSGTNDQAGGYVQTPDAKIYYERYGDRVGPSFFCTAGNMDTSMNLPR